MYEGRSERENAVPPLYMQAIASPAVIPRARGGAAGATASSPSRCWVAPRSAVRHDGPTACPINIRCDVRSGRRDGRLQLTSSKRSACGDTAGGAAHEHGTCSAPIRHMPMLQLSVPSCPVVHELLMKACECLRAEQCSARCQWAVLVLQVVWPRRCLFLGALASAYYNFPVSHCLQCNTNAARYFYTKQGRPPGRGTGLRRRRGAGPSLLRPMRYVCNIRTFLCYSKIPSSPGR